MKTNPSPTPFPHFLSIAALLATCVGLSAAALNIQWGAAPPAADALSDSWLYANIMLACTWLVLWPAFTLRRIPDSSRNLLIDLLALGISAIPALGAAAFLSGVPLHGAGPMLALQIAFALFTSGILAQSRTRPALAPPLAILLTFLALVTPILAYLDNEFFSTSSHAWQSALPLLALYHADAAANSSTWWTTLIYAAAGLLFIAIPRPPFQHTKI